MVRNYLKAAGFYSYDAAAEGENPVMRWIGREVKRFLTEAHIHLPFLLRLANAPPELEGEFHNVETDGVSSPTNFTIAYVRSMYLYLRAYTYSPDLLIYPPYLATALTSPRLWCTRARGR